MLYQNLAISTIVFALGTAIGSFVNALEYRLRHNLGFTRERSQCPGCGHTLAWYDLVPILSFIHLRGKCRYCGKLISFQYPLVELTTGILFVIFFVAVISNEFGIMNYEVWSPNSSIIQLLINLTNQLSGQPITQFLLNLPKYSIAQVSATIVSLLYIYFIITALITIFLYDLKYGLIPTKIIIWAGMTSLFYQSSVIFIHSMPAYILPHLGSILLSAFGSALFFYLLIKITKGKGMGLGDLYLGFLMGLILGYPRIILALYFAFIPGALVSLLLIALNKRTMKQAVPFGPFLVAGTLIGMLI
ncbi:prepilin peptidase [Patescibacteria group bacterium]|nr:prepilin peptidase [Patescibacteria group bacterium]